MGPRWGEGRETAGWGCGWRRPWVDPPTGIDLPPTPRGTSRPSRGPEPSVAGEWRVTVCGWIPPEEMFAAARVQMVVRHPNVLRVLPGPRARTPGQG